MTCDDTSQTAAQVVTSSALSLYSLTFLTWYISYDSQLKRCLKNTFLLPLLICVFPSLAIFFFLSIWPWPVWLCCFRCDCCFYSKQRRLHPRSPCLILIPDFHRLSLCSNNSQVFASWKKLAVKFEQAQISRKPPQAIASCRSQTKHKHAQAKNLNFDQKLWSGLKDECQSHALWACIIVFIYGSIREVYRQ